MKVALLIALALLVTPARAAAQEPDRCQVHVILFVPGDVKPPVGYQPRIDQIVDYAESFFTRELNRWGHQKPVMPFHRSADRHVEVMLLRGKENASKYKPVSVRMEVMDELRRQNKMAGGRQIWWIMVYAGDPPAKFPGFLGGFGPQIGGWSVCNFDTTPGRIDPAAPLGSDFLERIFLKGMIHELGHGFGLPHIGPLARDKAGNTLMGPTHLNYRRVMGGGEERVYLSEAEAAMFASHPAFRAMSDDREGLPMVEVDNMQYTAEPRKRSLMVKGRLRAAQPALYALVADEAGARPGEYWTKTYVAKVGADGAFEVIVSEPAESGGTLKTWFIFESGVQTGDGKSRGRDSGISRQYVYDGKKWTFK